MLEIGTVKSAQKPPLPADTPTVVRLVAPFFTQPPRPPTHPRRDVAQLASIVAELLCRGERI
jgi:hypothetical protein